jgi:hypothetical protein
MVFRKGKFFVLGTLVFEGGLGPVTWSAMWLSWELGMTMGRWNLEFQNP